MNNVNKFLFYSLAGLLSLFYFGATCRTKPDPDALLMEAKRDLRSAVNRRDSEMVHAARDKLERILGFEEIEREWLVHYYLTYADYRLVHFEPDTSKKIEALDRGLLEVKRSLEGKENFSESHTLHSALLGLEIRFRPEKAGRNSMLLGMEIGRAITLHIENPRARLINAIQEMRDLGTKGEEYSELVLEKFLLAVDFFDMEAENPSEDSMMPDWGSDEVHVWLALFYEELGHDEMVELELNRALRINPDLEWAREELDRLK
jgi:hypothetical protein